MIWGLNRVERVEITNHPILQWRQPYRRRQKNGEITLRIWCGRNLARAILSGNFSAHRENMLRTNSRCAQKKQKKTKGTAVPRPFCPITHSFFVVLDMACHRNSPMLSGASCTFENASTTGFNAVSSLGKSSQTAFHTILRSMLA